MFTPYKLTSAKSIMKFGLSVMLKPLHYCLFFILTGCSAGGSFLSSATGDKDEQKTEIVQIQPSANLCPLAEIRAGAETLRLYSGEPSDSNLKVQLYISEVKRSCVTMGSQTQITVAMAGTVIQGAKSDQNSYNAPIRTAIIDKNFEPVAGNLQNHIINLNEVAADNRVIMTLEPIIVDTTDPLILKDYLVYIGFDG